MEHPYTALLKGMAETSSHERKSFVFLRIRAIHGAKTTKNQTPLVRFA